VIPGGAPCVIIQTPSISRVSESEQDALLAVSSAFDSELPKRTGSDSVGGAMIRPLLASPTDAHITPATVRSRVSAAMTITGLDLYFTCGNFDFIMLSFLCP
jgi:hypothetical protein